MFPCRCSHGDIVLLVNHASGPSSTESRGKPLGTSVLSDPQPVSLLVPVGTPPRRWARGASRETVSRCQGQAVWPLASPGDTRRAQDQYDENGESTEGETT
ncbi:hypothetical protein EYF80_060930 [Liparis tanakae]|uniref:Uncharacterized protein n=1 Tax=Liparis tanakae TaxID=230148 RepID=A0A4Z2EKN3_9TELE|nr:hypothetical protein EYF80_060930 [Liparis tanakae]